MPYQPGFVELGEVDEKRFLDELGMSKEKLAAGMRAPASWVGVPRFRAPADLWIDAYKAYADGLSIDEKAALHRSINRLFFSLKEGHFVSREEHQKKRAVFRDKFIIPRSMRDSKKAEVWLKLAGAYTQRIIAKNRQELRRRAIAEFRTRMPVAWLDIEKAGYRDPVQKRAYAAFMMALRKHWKIFLESYENEVHGAVINNAPYAASLQSFLRGEYPDVRGPLPRPTNPMVYWPKPLHAYAGRESARALLEAKKIETEALKSVLSAGTTTTISYFPRWLRMGVQGADVTTPPPLLRRLPR